MVMGQDQGPNFHKWALDMYDCGRDNEGDVKIKQSCPYKNQTLPVVPFPLGKVKALFTDDPQL